MTLHIETKAHDRIRVTDDKSPFRSWEGNVITKIHAGLVIGKFIGSPDQVTPLVLTFHEMQLSNVQSGHEWENYALKDK